MPRDFPPRLEGNIYLTEAGTETEVLYKWGYTLPEFSMYPLLDDPEAHATITAMFRRYLDVCAAPGAGMLMASHDYRASPDWAYKIGYSEDQLADFQRRTITFLDGIRAEYADRTANIYITCAIGPRGDAYGTGGTITADEAAQYHLTQLTTVRDTAADMATAVTFNNVPEAVGVIRAAETVGLPIGVSLTLTTEGRLRSGPTLREAVEEIDAETNGAAAWFGTNCAHPLEFEEALADTGPWLDRMRYIRPNAVKMDQVALCKLGHLEDGDPVELGQQMGDVARHLPKADILGGCCGTDERHLLEIATRALEVRAA